MNTLNQILFLLASKDSSETVKLFFLEMMLKELFINDEGKKEDILSTHLNKLSHITDKERAKGRSENFHLMTPQEQWDEDKRLGILDWDGT